MAVERNQRKIGFSSNCDKVKFWFRPFKNRFKFTRSNHVITFDDTPLADRHWLNSFILGPSKLKPTTSHVTEVEQNASVPARFSFVSLWMISLFPEGKERNSRVGTLDDQLDGVRHRNEHISTKILSNRPIRTMRRGGGVWSAVFTLSRNASLHHVSNPKKMNFPPICRVLFANNWAGSCQMNQGFGVQLKNLPADAAVTGGHKTREFWKKK